MNKSSDPHPPHAPSTFPTLKYIGIGLAVAALVGAALAAVFFFYPTTPHIRAVIAVVALAIVAVPIFAIAAIGGHREHLRRERAKELERGVGTPTKAADDRGGE